MKKLLFFLSLVFISPAWALCSVDSNESVCSVSDFSSSASDMPLFKMQNTSGINSGNNINNPANIIKPTGLNNSLNKTQNSNGVHMQGSLGCQFGNCNRGANNDFLENQ